MEAPAEDCCAASAASAAAARVEAIYADLPGGYDVDKEAALYNDSLTYGEMATSDLALLVQRVRFLPESLFLRGVCASDSPRVSRRCRATHGSTSWTSGPASASSY